MLVFNAASVGCDLLLWFHASCSCPSMLNVDWCACHVCSQVPAFQRCRLLLSECMLFSYLPRLQQALRLKGHGRPSNDPININHKLKIGAGILE